MPVSNYQAPDLYIEEVPVGARPIQAVGTSIAGFVGVAPDPRERVGEAVAITNRSQFNDIYAQVGRTNGRPASGNVLSRAINGFFENGGSMCYVCNIASEADLVAGLDALGRIDEIAIVVAPGITGAAAADALLTHCENLKDRVCIIDVPEGITDVNKLTRVSTGDPTDEEAGFRPRNSDNGFGAVYYPWIEVVDSYSREKIFTPPSGHIAGIWARTDATRGVHKAPANEIIRGALRPQRRISRDEHGILNSAGVNAIRFYSGEGVRVMGARTVAPAANEYRYLNVRRLFSMVEESIAESLRWVIFEPNDRPLWDLIRRDVTAFLLRIWRDGALQGGTPQQAFFVKCDEETNPQENIDAGIVTTVIGMAPVKPAEFVVFRISQYAGNEAVEEGAE